MDETQIEGERIITNAELKADLSNAARAVTIMVAEEIDSVKSNQKKHQEKDDLAFGELKVSHNEIITMLAESKEQRKVMMDSAPFREIRRQHSPLTTGLQ